MARNRGRSVTDGTVPAKKESCSCRTESRKVGENVYGIDMPSANELIAHNRSVEEVQNLIGADWLVYQDLEDLISCVNDVNDEINDWECSVFTGNYITGDVDQAYLERIDAARNDQARKAPVVQAELSNLDMHNFEA